MRLLAILLLGSLLAGCGTAPTSETSGTWSPTKDTETTATPSSSSTSATTSGPARFSPGIYYSKPPLQPGFARLVHLEGDLRHSTLLPNGYALSEAMAISTDSQSTILVLHPDGTQQRIAVPGLFHIGRPTISPDGTHIAVQATSSSAPLTNEPDSDFDIYVVDLADGSSLRISDLDVNEESPEWVPGTQLVAYSSFDPQTGVDLHLRDATGNEVSRFSGSGGLHLDISNDGTRILECKRLRILDRTTGALQGDLLQSAVDGMEAAGYQKDAVHDGFQHQGSFPLDCAFSPDGSQLVFDGAVTGNGEGLLLMQMGLDGSGFKVLAGPIAVDPARSNNDNYSQLNPEWL